MVRIDSVVNAVCTEAPARAPSRSNADFRDMVAQEEATPDPKPVSGWAGLVTPRAAEIDPAPAAAPPPPAAPTAEAVFGDSPWMTAPAGQGPLGVYYYNPTYFATADTAAKVAQMLGGSVVQRNAFCTAGSPFQQQQPNYMVELPDGRLVNPGLVATYYTHGWQQSFIDRMLAIEAGPSPA